MISEFFEILKRNVDQSNVVVKRSAVEFQWYKMTSHPLHLKLPTAAVAVLTRKSIKAKYLFILLKR